MIRALVICIVLLGASPAAAYWTAGGTGSAFGTADTLPAGNQPMGAASGSTVTVSWLQTVFRGLPLGGYSNGGYVVRRYPASGGAAVTPAAGCATTIAGAGTTLSCAEANVPPGAWQYTVGPVLGSWTGAESPKSVTVLVAARRAEPHRGDRAEPGRRPGHRRDRLDLGRRDRRDGLQRLPAPFDRRLRLRLPGQRRDAGDGDELLRPGSGLAGATAYAYVVRAVTASAESANSNERAATAITRPAPPASATATPIAGGQISVSWPGVAVAGGYNVYRRLATGTYDFSTPLNGATPVAGTAFVDTTAVNATTYRYVIRSAITGVGGVWLESLTSSPESNAATSDAVAPSGVTIADPGSPLRGTVTLSGTATDTGSGVASVRMQIAPAGTSTWSTACTDTTAPYSCSVDTTSIADGLYDVRALATDVAGNTATSAVVANRRDRQHRADRVGERSRRQRARHDHGEHDGRRCGLRRGVRDDSAGADRDHDLVDDLHRRDLAVLVLARHDHPGQRRL